MQRKSTAEENHKRAWLLYLEKRHAQAATVLHDNIAEFPDYAPSHLLLGKIHLNSPGSDGSAAIREFGEVVRVEKESAEGFYWLGAALDKVGRIDEAIEAYTEATRLSARDQRPRVALGHCYMRKAWYTEAVLMFRKALQLRPAHGDAEVRMFLADALLKNGETMEACREWENVMADKPGDQSLAPARKEARAMLAIYRKSEQG